jgi:hypothetical protein
LAKWLALASGHMFNLCQGIIFGRLAIGTWTYRLVPPGSMRTLPCFHWVITWMQGWGPQKSVDCQLLVWPAAVATCGIQGQKWCLSDHVKLHPRFFFELVWLWHTFGSPGKALSIPGGYKNCIKGLV